MDRMRLLLLVVLSLSALSPTRAQNETPGSANQIPTIKTNVRVVLVDVVVTKKNDEPVTGLTKDDFQVFEDGKPQTLASFDEHAGVPDVPELSRMAKLPPNVFSNAPLAKAGDAANVLLLDSLNTDMADQSYVHGQMLKYLKDVRPGTRMAIFTLGDRLRFVQGFTEDPALLMAAMNGKNGAGNPQPSSLRQTPAELNATQQLTDQMQALAASVSQGYGASQGSASLQEAALDLARFLAENAASQTGVRANRTLEAINQLAMYLQAIPGRKNVIWFSGSFPLRTLAADRIETRDFGDEVGKTANLLAAARIAIYPFGVGEMGLLPNRIYDFSQQQPPNVATSSPEQQMTQFQNHSLDSESTERVQNSASLQEIAQNTGGEFFLNTNGFNDVLDHVIKTGTYYYTLTYSPTNQKMDGELRHIQVKLTDAKYKLAYRRGYYATQDFMSPVMTRAANEDPLRRLMEHGTPDSTGILFTMKVMPAARIRTLEPGSGSPRAGDNDKLSGAVTRYTATFTVLPQHLALDSAHHGNVEVTLLAYDRDGIPLNWMVRALQVRVPREHFEQAQANGVGFNLEIDVPASAVYLRSGLYDMGSSKAGTLEIPIAALVPSAALASDAAAPSSAPTPAAVPAAGATVPVPAGTVSSAASNLPTDYALMAANEAALEATKELETVDIPDYCWGRTQKEEHSASLAAVCEFVLTLRKKLSDVICDRETKRYWVIQDAAFTSNGISVGGAAEHSDLVSVHVTYHNGQENYSDFRLDGQPVPFNEPGLSGSWSHGEFATLLASIFAPTSKAQFHYSKQRNLHATSALVFDFKVSAENNRFYFLQSHGVIWFPEYTGTIWIDARTSSLLRLQLETAYAPNYPIRHAKAEIEYANLLLGDGISMVLPTSSKDQICQTPPFGCTRSVIHFTNWHKFHATTHMLQASPDQ